MKMRIRHAVAAVAIPVIMSVAATPSFAFSLGSIEHAIGGEVKAITKEAGKVTKEVGKVEKGTVKAVEGATKEAAHVTGNVAKEVAKEVPKAANLAGTVASKGYKELGTLAGEIPGLKQFKPLATDASKCAKSREGKIGIMVGAGLAVGTGGLSNIAEMAGAGAADGCISTGAYNDGKKAVNEAETFAKRQANDLRKSWRNP
jgi:hypothetical protein